MEKEDVKAMLKKSGISPSYQRMRIMEYLVNTKAHPTVEMIYRELIDDIPTLSKTTVYNTLNTFMENGLVSIITIDEAETRYDADTKLHGHFKCEKCGAVEDIEIEVSDKNFKGLEKYKVYEKHIYFKGECSKCIEKNK